MAEINEGVVKITLPTGLDVPAQAGRLSDDQVRELAKVRTGLGLACVHTATELEKVASEFTVPGVVAPALKTAGQKADLWDEVIADLELALRVAKQANLIADNDAFTMLRKVNNQVKAQAAFSPKLKERFATVGEYFASARRTPKAPEGETE